MYAKSQTIDSWLDAHASHQPTRIALNFEEQSWTYSELHEWVLKLSNVMVAEFTLTRGDRISYYGKNTATEVALLFAAAQLGLILVPLNWRLADPELNYILKDSGAKILFHDGSFVESLLRVTGDLDLRKINITTKLVQLVDEFTAQKTPTDAELCDPYLIVYTSGTTGHPKGAVITQEAVVWNALISLHAHDFTYKDHTLNLLPLFHVGGINIQMMPTFYVGGEVTLHASFDPSNAINSMQYDGITSTVCVPTVMNALLNHPNWVGATFPNLRLINTGSTDVPVELLKTVQEFGIDMVQVYGATETGPMTTYQKAHEARSTVGSIGRCGIHTQVSLRKPSGAECECREPGEIWVKGPNNFSHYWNNPEETRSTVVDGWFKTGDVAFKDEDGLFWFVDRTKHVIITGGENIYPAELERLLHNQPEIIEAAVVGQPDPKWGEVPIVVVVASNNSLNKDQVLSIFQDRVAKFKTPKDVIFVEALPKNALGKIQVGKVRDLVQSILGSKD